MITWDCHKEQWSLCTTATIVWQALTFINITSKFSQSLEMMKKSTEIISQFLYLKYNFKQIYKNSK